MASTSDPAAQDAWLKARLTDALDQCDRYAAPRFVGFLDERQQAAARAILRRATGVTVRFFGGHPDAERALAGMFPSYMEPLDELFPLTAVGFVYRQEATLTHRDFLGALLSCGIKREKLGDILCAPGLAVAFVDEGLAPFLADQIDQVRREGVRLEIPYTGELPAAHTFREKRDTVASPRLDAVVKAAAGISREEAARRIATGLVQLDHVVCQSASAEVKQGMILSIRGVGRFLVQTIGPPTRKGRLGLILQQYC
ncbi:MAG: RNA-binding protein [Acutalibacteraceae bacterium]|jgi:RNA-binding protein YlmH